MIEFTCFGDSQEGKDWEWYITMYTILRDSNNPSICPRATVSPVFHVSIRELIKLGGKNVSPTETINPKLVDWPELYELKGLRRCSFYAN